MILRELAAAWVKANCPSADVHRGFLQQFDDALGRSVGCSFVIGQRLTKSGTPYLVHCFCGELFAFQLTTPVVPPPQIAKQRLGERFVPPVPIPTLMTAETMAAPAVPTPWPPEPDGAPNPNRIRAISDIHAVLVEVA